MKWTHSRNICVVHKEETGFLVIIRCMRTFLSLSKHECVDTDTKRMHMKASLTYVRTFETTEDTAALTVR